MLTAVPACHLLRRNRMNIFFTAFTAIAFFLGIYSSFGRIGQTLDECALDYGSTTGNLAKDQITFRHSGVIITVHVENGKSVREDFAPENGTMLSDDQIAALLQENAGGSSWEKSGETATVVSYSRKDGHASARAGKLNEQGAGRIKLAMPSAELIIKSE